MNRRSAKMTLAAGLGAVMLGLVTAGPALAKERDEHHDREAAHHEDAHGQGDGRQAIALGPEAKNAVVAEMLGMMGGVQQVLQGLAQNDRQMMAEGAHAAGTTHMVDDDPALAALPKAFVEQGEALHRGFDALAQAAQGQETPAQLAGRLAGLMAACNTCHQQFRIK